MPDKDQNINGNNAVKTQQESTAQKASGMAIASLVLGIISLLFLCCCPYLFGPLGIVAWVLGQLELNSIKRGQSPPSGRGMAIAGLVLGIVSSALFALLIIFYIVATIFGVGIDLLDKLPKSSF